MKKTALIIGATSEMASAIAREYAANGYDLILAARAMDRLEPIARDMGIRHPEASVSAVLLDVLDFASHREFYDNLPHKPDVGICVAGNMGDHERAAWDPEELRMITDTNYTGCASILNIIAADFEQRGQGVIIGVSSVAGERGRKSNYYYGSAKAALTSYLSGLRHRLAGTPVRVITVKPGFVRTRMTEGLPLPGLLMASVEQVARDIYSAQIRKKDVVYTRWFWRYIMLIIKHLPEAIFKRTNL